MTMSSLISIPAPNHSCSCQLGFSCIGIPASAARLARMASGYRPKASSTVLLDVDGDAKADYRLRVNGDVSGDTPTWIL